MVLLTPFLLLAVIVLVQLDMWPPKHTVTCSNWQDLRNAIAFQAS